MTLLRAVARPMLASMFVVGGANALRNAPVMAPAAKPVTDRIIPTVRRAVPGAPIPTDPTTLVRINGAVQLVAGLALATGRAPRVAAFVLAASLAPTTAAGHRFWEETDAGTRKNQQIHFFKNLSMTGGLLMATLDPDPKKKVLYRRAKDRAVVAADAVSDAASQAVAKITP